MAEAVRAIMLSWLLTHGYQPYQAEALIKSAWIESRLQPCAAARDGSVGLFQWLGKRRRDLHRFAGTAGCPSVESQLAYLDYELRSPALPFKVFFTVPPKACFPVFRNCYEKGRC